MQFPNFQQRSWSSQRRSDAGYDKRSSSSNRRRLELKVIRGKLDKQALVINFDNLLETWTVTQARMIPNKTKLPKAERSQLISGRWFPLNSQDFGGFSLAWDFVKGAEKLLKDEGYKVSVVDNTAFLPVWR